MIFVGGCQESPSDAKRTVYMDGSSTVYPIVQAAAEEFSREYPWVSPKVGTSGTGGGIRKLIGGQIDIATASRPINAEERKQAIARGLRWVEFPLARDGIAVIVHPDNPLLGEIDLGMLRRMWQPGSQVHTWRDLNSIWPDEKLTLYGPDTASGTFESFTKLITGLEKFSRTDYQQSGRDNILVKAVASDRFSLGYLGFGYYAENRDKLKALAVNGIAPTVQTVTDGSYPLTRKLYLYVNEEVLYRPEIQEFLRFFLRGRVVFIGVHGVPLPSQEYSSWEQRLSRK